MSRAPFYMPESNPQSQSPAPDEQVNRVLDKVLMNFFPSHPLSPVQQQVIERMKFVLVGYNTRHEHVEWHKGLKHVQHIERKLIVDPDKIAAELARIKNESDVASREEMSNKTSLFSSEGGHAFCNSQEILARVRREGWIILAGLENDERAFVPIGYNYGLDSMPEGHEHGDHEFASLDYDTLSLSEHSRRMHMIDPKATTVNWRTSVLPSVPADQFRRTFDGIPADEENISLRRIGIGSALKYIITFLALARGQTHLSFNIGTIYEYGHERSKSIRLRNTASFEHNKRIFDMEPAGEGYRDHATALERKRKSAGKRDFVATILWYARMNGLRTAMEKLQAKESVLATRKWDLLTLGGYAETIQHQINEEKRHGTHI